MEHILACHEIVKTDFVRAEDCYLYDSTGRRYIDFEAGIWCTALGYGHPRINDAIQAQLKNVTHLGTRYPSTLAEKAALEVLDIIGFETGKCVFLCSGSEAVEFGVQISQIIHPDKLMLKFSTAFLGSYGTAHSKASDIWHIIDWNVCQNDLETCLDTIPFERIGAFIFEPGGSSPSFVHFPPKSVVEAIAARVQETGGLVVSNEITTGMGRTGRWFGFQHYDIQPDIVALGKGLGNGYPVSAVAIRQNIARHLEDSGFLYAQSHQNDPLGCTVAHEVITVMKEEQWIPHGNQTGALFLDRLQQIVEACPLAKETRGRGLLLGLELHPHKTLTAQNVYQQLLTDGFLTNYYPVANLLRFDPALTIQEQHIDELITSLKNILNQS